MRDLGHTSRAFWLAANIGSAFATPAVGQDIGRSASIAERSAELPIVVVVPFAPGGSADRVAAVVADSLGQALGRRVATRNVSGGIGVAALNEVAEIVPQEIRVGYATSTQLIEATLRNRPARYQPMSEFEWLGIVGTFGNAVVVGAGETAQTFDEWRKSLPARARRQRWGVGAATSSSALAARFLATTLGINVEIVEYMAADDAYEALRTGAIDANFDGLPNALQEASRVDSRIIAITSRDRSPAVPAIPAFGQYWPSEDFSILAALVVSIKEPEGVRGRLKAGWYGIGRLTSARARLEQIGVKYLGLDSEQAVAFMEDSYLRHLRQMTRPSQP